jgi:glycosyltransferase involved in cell wall biosynthesis
VVICKKKPQQLHKEPVTKNKNPYFCRMTILKYWREGIFVLLCLVTLVQLAYYLGLFSKLAFFKPKIKSQNQEQPVSVIVCARDEAGNLVKNLPGVLVQDYKTTHEVVLVNDNSTDDSKYVIEELQKTFKNLNPLKLKQEAMMIPGKKFPLSMGIRAAKYETLLLTDADCVPASEHWMKLMQDGYDENTEIVLGYGAYHKAPGMLNKFIRFETFHSALQYLSYALAGIPYMGVGRNLSYKKEVFLRNKGFSKINKIPGGDDDLFINQVATKTNTNIVIDPDAHTLSAPKKTWQEWVTQKNRHYSTAKYYQKKHKLLLGLYSATQFLMYPLAIAAAIFFNWWLALIVFAVKLIVQGYIFNKTMKRLNEDDLWPMFIVLDFWMCIYYIMFLPALFKRPKKKWK